MGRGNQYEPRIDRTQELKRMAIQVVALLPSDATDAATVLAFAHDLVVDFLGDAVSATDPPAGNVVSLKR